MKHEMIWSVWHKIHDLSHCILSHCSRELFGRFSLLLWLKTCNITLELFLNKMTFSKNYEVLQTNQFQTTSWSWSKIAFLSERSQWREDTLGIPWSSQRPLHSKTFFHTRCLAIWIQFKKRLMLQRAGKLP